MVNAKLGKYESSTGEGWRDDLNARGHFVIIDINAKYDHGNASEEFVYKVDTGSALLAGYHITSNALLFR